MAVRFLDHVNISVADFAATVDWYRRMFGFEVVEEAVGEDGVHWGVIRAGEAMLCIYEFPDNRRLDSYTSRQQGTHNIAHFGIQMDDRAAWEETVARERPTVRFGGPVRWPHSTSWYVEDPTGHEIEVACWDGGRVAFG